MTHRILLSILALMLAACGPKSDAQQKSTPKAPGAYQSNVSLLVSVDQTPSGKEAVPNFSWYNEKGQKVSFREISKGKPVLINFWATWCGPCVKETPDIVELHHELSSKGVVFIGISADLGDDAMELVTSFTKQYKVPYQIIVDNNGDLQTAFGGLRGYPTTFYIDKSGKIVKRLLGLQSKEKFAKEFDAIL
jgi:thiol-disulfide isomerase/thioredoxin